MATHLVAFNLEEQQYALPLRSVRRVIRSVEITALAKAPAIVLGIIDLQGEMVPVISNDDASCFQRRTPAGRPLVFRNNPDRKISRNDTGVG